MSSAMLKLVDLLTFQVIIDEYLDCSHLWCEVKYYLIHLLTAIGLTPGGSSTAHSYTQTVHRTAQW